MLALVGMWQDDPADALADGSAYDMWRRVVAVQGGRPDAPLPVAPHVAVVPAQTAGVLRRLGGRTVGVVVWLLGAGRHRKHDPVSPVAGRRRPLAGGAGGAGGGRPATPRAAHR